MGKGGKLVIRKWATGTKTSTQTIKLGWIEISPPPKKKSPKIISGLPEVDVISCSNVYDK